MQIDSARRRLERADTHVQALEDEIQQYVKDGAGRQYTLSPERDPGGSEYLARLRVSEPPDLVLWSLIVSDVVHQVRCSLDNLLWSVGTQHSSARKLGRFYFPICTTEQAWT